MWAVANTPGTSSNSDVLDCQRKLANLPGQRSMYFMHPFAPFSLNNGQQIGGGVAAVVISTALIGMCSRTTIFVWNLTMASFQSFSGMILSVVTRFVDLNGTLLRVCSSAST